MLAEIRKNKFKPVFLDIMFQSQREIFLFKAFIENLSGSKMTEISKIEGSSLENYTMLKEIFKETQKL